MAVKEPPFNGILSWQYNSAYFFKTKIFSSSSNDLVGISEEHNFVRSLLNTDLW